MAALLVLVGSCPAAEMVEDHFSGEVLTVSDRSGLFRDAFAPGSPVTGYYSYEPADMTAVPSQPPHTALFVAGGNAPSPLNVTLGGATFEPFPDSMLRVQLIDDNPLDGDLCLVGSPTRFPFDYPRGRDLLFPDVALTLSDPAGGALSSLDVGAVDHAAMLFPRRRGRVIVRDAETQVIVAEAEFSVGTVVAAPEPAAGGVFGFVCAALTLRRRRGNRR